MYIYSWRWRWRERERERERYIYLNWLPKDYRYFFLLVSVTVQRPYGPSAPLDFCAAHTGWQVVMVSPRARPWVCRSNIHFFSTGFVCKPRRSKKNCRCFFIVMFYCHNFQFRTIIFRIIFPIRGFGLGHWESMGKLFTILVALIFHHFSQPFRTFLHPRICSQPFFPTFPAVVRSLPAPQPRLGHGLRIGASKKTMAAAFAQQTLVPHGHRLLELAVGIGFGVLGFVAVRCYMWHVEPWLFGYRTVLYYWLLLYIVIYYHIWLVVWNIFLLSIIYGIVLPIDSYFSKWLKPPTRYNYYHYSSFVSLAP